MHNKYRPPVIILGMHRSGTTLIVRLLRDLGFFAGERLTTLEESNFFVDINEWIMRRSGGSWDYPLPTKKIFGINEVRLEIERLLSRSINSREFSRFSGSGIGRVIKPGSCPSVPWGWKDPRNTFTVKLWLSIFPEAKILYIRRNGVDVANSLHVRANQWLADGKSLFPTRSFMGKLLASRHVFERYISRSIRCCSLMECFRLWEEYSLEAEEFYDGFDGEKLIVEYETLLKEPLRELSKAAEFCSLEYSNTKLESAASRIDSERAYAFTSDKTLCEFYGNVRLSYLMERLEYNEIITRA